MNHSAVVHYQEAFSLGHQPVFLLRFHNKVMVNLKQNLCDGLIRQNINQIDFN